MKRRVLQMLDVALLQWKRTQVTRKAKARGQRLKSFEKDKSKGKDHRRKESVVSESKEKRTELRFWTRQTATTIVV